MNLNKVFLAGNLTRDPDLRYTPGGAAVVNLSIAVNRKWKTTDGQDKEEVCYVDLVNWGKSAEAMGKYLKRASPIFIEGRLQFESWEKDGEKRYRLKVCVENWQFLSKKEGGDSTSQDSPKHSNQSAPRDVGDPSDESSDVPF
jgi:single-strand DNA-binding protein